MLRLKYFLLLVGLSAYGASAARVRSQRELRAMFREFVTINGKQYASNADFQERFQVFMDNVRLIDTHNADSRASWTMGINQFADMTEKEFRDTYLTGYVRTPVSTKAANGRALNRTRADLPESVDWRQKGAVSEVRVQGVCGSCWAFAATEQIESYLFLDTKEMTELSAQQLTSCVPNPLQCGGQGGCAGSVPQLAFTYTNMFGLATDKSYPYKNGGSNVTQMCEFDPETTPAFATVRGYETLPRNDLDAVMEHLALRGPLAVSMDASAWRFYRSGVFDGCSFSSNINLNHAVQLVGYGVDNKSGQKYWLLRNSWGPDFGESGYIRIRRQDEVQCGTDSTPLYGVACVGDGQTEQHVCGTCGILFDTSYPVGVRKAT